MEGKALAVYGDLPLLHRLEQGRLGARDGAVDLVGEEDVRHHGALTQLKVAGLLIVYPHADDVARQHVGHELDASRLAAEGDGYRLDHRRLADAGQVVEQDMSVREDGHDYEFDAVGFADDYLLRLRLYAGGEFFDVHVISPLCPCLQKML